MLSECIQFNFSLQNVHVIRSLSHTCVVVSDGILQCGIWARHSALKKEFDISGLACLNNVC